MFKVSVKIVLMLILQIASVTEKSMNCINIDANLEDIQDYCAAILLYIQSIRIVNSTMNLRRKVLFFC